MSERNRSEGWKYAKKTGHQNEELVKNYVLNNTSVQNALKQLTNKEGRIINVSGGGSHEKEIPCVLGGFTKAKPDLLLSTDIGEHINVSLKKSNQGQVFLISVERFIKGFEQHYKVNIPTQIKRAMSLFWGVAEDTGTIIQNNAIVAKQYQKRKNRLVYDTLQRYDSNLSSELIKWFKGNISEIFDFCFIRGLANNDDCWADIIWYINLIPGKENTIEDVMLNLYDMREKIKYSVKDIEYGLKNGGTTIQLPFGFVQWHQGQMQFHHKMEKILNISAQNKH